MSKTTKYLLAIFFVLFIAADVYFFVTYFKSRKQVSVNEHVTLIPTPASFDAGTAGNFAVSEDKANLSFVGELKKVLVNGGSIYANVLLSNGNVQTVILSEKANPAGGALTFIKAKVTTTLQFDQIEAEMNNYMNKPLIMSLKIDDCNQKLLTILQTKKNEQLTCLPRIGQVEAE